MLIVRIYRLRSSQFISFMNLSIYHAAVEFDEIEYCFDETSVRELNPREFFKTNLSIDSIEFKVAIINRSVFYKLLEKLKEKFAPGTYSTLIQNCNHYVYDILQSLFPDKFKETGIYLKLKILTGNFLMLIGFNDLVNETTKLLSSVDKKGYKYQILPIRIYTINKPVYCQITNFNCTHTKKSDYSTKDASFENEENEIKKILLSKLTPRKIVLSGPIKSKTNY